MAKGAWREFGVSSTEVGTCNRSDIHNKSLRQVRLFRTKVGKRGKTVTIIRGLEMNQEEMKSLLKSLKSLCGTGGTVKEDVVEIQGDHIKTALQFLSKEGFRPKQSGG